MALWLRSLVGVSFVLSLAAPACGFGDDADDKAKAKKEKADAPTVERTKRIGGRRGKGKRDKVRPKACIRAEACCEEMAYFRDQDPGFLCSGVKKVDTGAKCREFHEGYAGVFEASGEPLPEECEQPD